MEVSPRPSGEIQRRNPQNDFELIQRVGSGTYGDVYKARNIKTGELAAVKIIKLEPGDDFSIIQQEIFMVKECMHHNIVAYFGSYLWMRLLRGPVVGPGGAVDWYLQRKQERLARLLPLGPQQV